MNKAVEDFNNQLRETIRLLEREEMVLRRKQTTKKTLDEDKIIETIRRYV